MATPARQRMIESAVLLIRERGVAATSFTDVLEHAGTTRGTIYHHFPGGKAQLVEEATAHAGAAMADGLRTALGQMEPVPALAVFLEVFRARLIETDYAAGCPILAAALEADRTPGARDAAATAFASWHAPVADLFARYGVEPERAGSLATLVIAAVEGAVVMARAERSTAPLDRIGAELERLARDATLRERG